MTPLQPGDQLDHYLLEEEVAITAMSTMFRGVDRRTGQRVAIKVPQPMAESDPVFFDRFKREIEIGKALQHTAIPRVLNGVPQSRPRSGWRGVCCAGSWPKNGSSRSTVPWRSPLRSAMRSSTFTRKAWSIAT